MSKFITCLECDGRGKVLDMNALKKKDIQVYKSCPICSGVGKTTKAVALRYRETHL